MVSRFLPILVYPAHGGVACPAISQLQQVHACDVGQLPEACFTTNTCQDQVVNNGESGVDCGGTSACGACAIGQQCDSAADCATQSTCSVGGVCLCTCLRCGAVVVYRVTRLMFGCDASLQQHGWRRLPNTSPRMSPWQASLSRKLTCLHSSWNCQAVSPRISAHAHTRLFYPVT